MKQEKYYLYYFLRAIYIVLLKILYHPKVIGKENIPKEGPCILAGNHFCAVDPVMVMAQTKRRVVFLAKKELFWGLHGKIFKKLGLIPVYPDRANGAAMREAEKVLTEGGVIGIFPEGKRNRERDKHLLLPFKKGCVRMAQRTGATIIPFAISGRYIPFFAHLQITFGKPIQIKNTEDIKEVNESVRNEVMSLIRM